MTEYIGKIPERENKEPTMQEKVDTLFYENENIIKRKELRIPRKAKVKGRKAKKGWVGILRVSENGVISGEKVLLEDSSYVMADKLVHATEGKEKLMWEGKFPVYIQEAKKNNPKLVSWNEGDNETYGQPYIRAKMLQEAIKPKSGGVKIILILLAVGAGIFLVSKLFSGGT